MTENGRKIKRAQKKRARARNRVSFAAAVAKLKSRPCADCGGVFHPVAMDFDHRDRSLKTRSVSATVNLGASWTLVLREIAKCDLVCANCHRVRTHNGGHYVPHDIKERATAQLELLPHPTPIPAMG